MPQVETRRDELLRVALRLFRERGYHNTGINEIAAAVGLTGPALYRHFASKDALLMEAITTGARAIGQAATSARDPAHSPGEALRALVRSYVDVAIVHRDMVAVFSIEARHLPHDYQVELAKSLGQYAEYWADTLRSVRPELDPDESQRYVRSAMFMVTAICLFPGRLEPERLRAITEHQVLAALLAPSVS